ncbi:MAG TPA: helix-turn-helix domain-containing protein [Clostridiaceae bacterium]|nr:helix-turn-helix domain-containing protein [Clostridiaceae bacterium]
MEQCKDIVDEKIGEIDRIITQLSLNDKIISLLKISNDFTGNEYYKLWEISKDLLPYTVSSDFMKYMFLYFRNSNVILSPVWGSYKLNVFFENTVKHDKITYEDWSVNISDKNIIKKVLPSLMLKFVNEEKPMLTYIHRITCNNPVNDGKIIVFIDNSQINKLLSRINLDGGGWISVLDAEGVPLINAGKIPTELSDFNFLHNYFSARKGYFEHNFIDSKMFVTYTTSSYNGWIYIAAVPKNIIMAKVAHVKRITIILTFLYLVSGLIIAYLLAYRNTKPVKGLIEKIKSIFSENFQNGKNEYEIIESTISRIVSKNEQLYQIIENQKPILKSAFIKRLINGEFSNMDELNAFMLNADIMLANGKFLVVILQITGYGEIIDDSILKELNKARAIISNIEIENKILSYDLNEKSIVLIFRYGEHDLDEKIKEHCEQTIKILNEKLITYYNIKCIFAFGDICNSILDIYSSYNKAYITMDAIKVKNYVRNNKSSNLGNDVNMLFDAVSVNGNNDSDAINGEEIPLISWYEEIPDKISAYFYPEKIEKRIIKLVKAGEVLELEKVLQYIYYENFSRRNLDKAELDNFLNELNNTYIKTRHTLNLLEDVSMDRKFEEITDIKNSINKIELFYKIQHRFVELCRKADEERKERNNELSKRIIEYIDSNYSNPNLSLQMMADYFGLNDVYMSRFFKKHIGENFSVYLEKVRIKKAAYMLRKQNYSIDTISKMVGYNNAVSFRRAFKKVIGANPSEYKMKI